MELLLFAVAALAIYAAADFLLLRIEYAMGRRLENRQVLFFVIILVLAWFAFYLIRLLLPGA